MTCFLYKFGLTIFIWEISSCLFRLIVWICKASRNNIKGVATKIKFSKIWQGNKKLKRIFFPFTPLLPQNSSRFFFYFLLKGGGGRPKYISLPPDHTPQKMKPICVTFLPRWVGERAPPRQYWEGGPDLLQGLATRPIKKTVERYCCIIYYNLTSLLGASKKIVLVYWVLSKLSLCILLTVNAAKI